MTSKKPHSSKNPAPKKLDRAEDRLSHAVARLEAVLEKGGANGAEDTEELQAARAENAVLKELNRTVGQRLDAAIERLQGALEGP